MEISFKSKRLRDLCEDGELVTQKYGESVARFLMDRLADLESALSIDDLIVGNPSISMIGRTEVLEIDLTEGYVIRMEPNQSRTSLNEEGRINWSGIRRVKIISIETND